MLMKRIVLRAVRGSEHGREHGSERRRTVSGNRRLVGVAAAALWLSSLFAVNCVAAAEEGKLRNWFNDPFFQVRNGAPACPVPVGPLSTEAEMRQQTHPRSERGTRCWLAGQCRLANSYLYDAAIGDAVRDRFSSTRAWREASLWVTVQRRIVWVEGCVSPSYKMGTLDNLVKKVPDVELVVVNVNRGRKNEVLPYRTLEAARK
jgi:hypothetical protein